MVTLRILDTTIQLEPAEGVFTPTPNGLFYAESVTVRAGERVIDIGTGSGILAIMAAKRGAVVHASDIDERSVRAACRNAALNGVEIDCRVGAMFGTTAEDAARRYDVILANLPNEIVAPAELEALGNAEVLAVDGGAAGNELLLELLAAAPQHMHERSRLYLPVHSLTDWHGTLRAAINRFRARLVDFRDLPVKPFVTAQLAWYRALSERGVITILQRDGGWYSRGYVFELTLPG